MKRVVILIALLALLACCGWGQTLQAHTICDGVAVCVSNGGTTPAINTTTSNFLVACYPYFQGNPEPTLSDSQTNTWSALTTYCNNNGVCIRMKYVANPSTNASHTFTISGASSFSTLTVQAWSGMATSTPFQTGTDQGNAAFGSDTNQLATITPTGTSIVVSCLGGDNDTFSATAVTDNAAHLTYTKSDSQDEVNPYAIQMWYSTTSGGSTTAPLWTVHQMGSAITAASEAAFTASGGGGGSAVAIPHIF